MRQIRSISPFSRFLQHRPPLCYFSNSSEDQTHFGFSTVDKEEKAKLVGDVFHRVANSYDVMNDAMSLGIHRLWKYRLIQRLQPFATMRHLDVAGGTGDIAFLSYEAMKHDIDRESKHSFPFENNLSSSIVVCDINPSMLGVGKSRATERGYLKEGSSIKMDFVAADAQELPFESNSFDAYTIAFGLRNVTNIDKALEEAHRVLKPGGQFLCLEFSKVQVPVLDSVYDFYSFNVIPMLGEAIANDKAAYQYLVESIRQFPEQEVLCEHIKSAGFDPRFVNYENQTGGICAIHSAVKI